MRENLRGLSPHGGFARCEEVRKRLIGFNVQHFVVKRREGPFCAVTVIPKVHLLQGGLFSDGRARGRDNAGLPLPRHILQVRLFDEGWSATKSVTVAAVPARRKAMP